MYHISDIKKFLRCELLYFYSRDEFNVFKPYLRSDENINELLKAYFNIEECFEGVKNDSPDRFLAAKDQYEWFFRPRLADGELRINIPLMHRKGDVYDLYFIYYNTSIKGADTITYRISLKVLEKNGIRVDEVYLLYFDPEYVNDGQLDARKLLICTGTISNKRLIDLIREEDFGYEKVLRKLEAIEGSELKPDKNRYCRLYGLCDYYERCYPDELDIADDSILTLVSSRNKNLMYSQGIERLRDADVDQLEGNRMQYAQIMASKNGGVFIDRYPLSSFLGKLDERPISFIDFEWDRYLVPPYFGMHPMDVVCFEFALYYIDEDGRMEHRTFVGTGDCRKEFVEALIEYLPKKGPILAYNAPGGEVLRLEELAEIFPEYKEDLEKITARFIDLAEPFMEGVVYDIRMKGNYSLKQLVKICSDYSYEDLDIDDGMEAVFRWRNLDRNEEDREGILDDLKEYCSLDAYGLFLVYRWLIKLMIEY